MVQSRGLAPFLALLALSAAPSPGSAQHNCTCATNKLSICSPDGPGGSCQCRALGSGALLDCSKLTAKCLLMHARARAPRGRSLVSPGPLAIVDNDGFYDPECDGEGRFKARQCNGTSVCWCVNSVGVRRTDKGDRGLQCESVVRTHRILIHLRHDPAAELNSSFLDVELRQLFRQRYGLRTAFLHAVRYDAPTIQIELRQNASQKAPGDVDIGDAAYYFERDVKGESLFPGHRGSGVPVRGGSLPVEHTLIYYLDEEPPKFTMQRLTAGIIAVIVVVSVALVAGGVVLVVTNHKRSGKYKKVEIKELGELRSEPSL